MKKEFKCNNFKLEYPNLGHFFQTSCACIHPITLTCIRGIFAVYSIVFMVISAAWDVKSPRWLIYATSWNYLLVSIYFVYSFGVSLIGLRKYAEFDEDRVYTTQELPLYIKIFWILYTTAITVCTFTVILYWAAIHDYNTELKADLDSYLIVDRHGVQFFLLLVEFSIHRIPLRFLHLVYPLIFGVTYALFNPIYWAISDEIIYSVTDWNESPGEASIATVLNVVAIVVVHFLMYWLNVFKLKCSNRKIAAGGRSNSMVLA